MNCSPTAVLRLSVAIERILDASALLAVLFREPGCAAVEPVMATAGISSVNLAEVVGKLAQRGLLDDVGSLLPVLGFRVLTFDEPCAYHCGRLLPAGRERGLSLGDRACLATAARWGLPAVTADRAWTQLKLDIQVECIR